MLRRHLPVALVLKVEMFLYDERCFTGGSGGIGGSGAFMIWLLTSPSPVLVKLFSTWCVRHRAEFFFFSMLSIVKEIGTCDLRSRLSQLQLRLIGQQKENVFKPYVAREKTYGFPGGLMSQYGTFHKKIEVVMEM